jgi:hypothetical protein
MIRLVTVIGHGVELLPHFIKHYITQVDEINIVVYESDISPNIKSEVETIVVTYDNVKIVKTIKDRVFDWEKVTQLYNMVTNKRPNDWWVIADIDEFHLYPNDDLKKIINDCDSNGWDIVRGGFIDRIGEGGNFVELQEDISIWEQFPNAGYFRYPMSRANPNKICVIKGYVELTNGQHYANIGGQTTWKWQGWNHPIINPNNTVQVHHFKWDKTSIERIRAVAEIKQTYAYSSEYAEMFMMLNKTRFKINLTNPEYMFEHSGGIGEYSKYSNWNKLIKKIISI